MNAFLLGPFLIKIDWLFLFISALIAALIIKTNTKNNLSFQNEVFNVMINIVIIFVLIYKFSSLLFSPEIIFGNFKTILYVTGGKSGAILGFVCGLFYLAWKVFKSKLKVKVWAEVLTYGSVSFFLSYWLIRTLYFLVF
ncbi:hypothetical protein AB1L05_00435 [Cytobacillus horneckiae]|uniref:hypothetical protein n=1 Tax=Cytobacillus horneckiae TaxID=549687 RepID=UPI0039A3BD77